MYFDRFLIEQYPNELTVTRHITDHYLQSISHLHPRSQFNRFSVVRQICRYIAQTDPCCYVPESIKCITASKVFHPHIFSKQEITNLLSAASTLQPHGSLRPYTYHTLFGLLYTTGIRIGEAFLLALKDFYPERELLYIAKGKFRKARWVPLHPTASRSLMQYVERRLRAGIRISRMSMLCFLRWPHICIASTHVYLHPTTELLEEVNNRFHDHYLRNLKAKGGKS